MHKHLGRLFIGMSTFFAAAVIGSLIIVASSSTIGLCVGGLVVAYIIGMVILTDEE